MTWPVAFILLVCLGVGIAVVGLIRSIRDKV